MRPGGRPPGSHRFLAEVPGVDAVVEHAARWRVAAEMLPQPEVALILRSEQQQIHAPQERPVQQHATPEARGTEIRRIDRCDEPHVREASRPRQQAGIQSRVKVDAHERVDVIALGQIGQSAHCARREFAGPAQVDCLDRAIQLRRQRFRTFEIRERHPMARGGEPIGQPHRFALRPADLQRVHKEQDTAAAHDRRPVHVVALQLACARSSPTSRLRRRSSNHAWNVSTFHKCPAQLARPLECCRQQR